jgi:hypothetical protein
MVIISVFQSMNNIFLHLISLSLSLSLFCFLFVCYEHLICRGRTPWSQTTQGNGILMNESCDIAPLFMHTHRKIKEFLKLSILLQHFSQYAQVCKSLGRTGSYESM